MPANCWCQLLYEEEVVYNQDGLSCIRTCPSSSRASSSTWSRQSAVTDASAHLEWWCRPRPRHSLKYTQLDTKRRVGSVCVWLQAHPHWRRPLAGPQAVWHVCYKSVVSLRSWLRTVLKSKERKRQKTQCSNLSLQPLLSRLCSVIMTQQKIKKSKAQRKCK